MCLGFHANAPRVVPRDDTGIVVKDREKPINILLHVVSGFHDVSFEQRINDGVLTGLVVDVVDA